jgi:hypothetical protein
LKECEDDTCTPEMGIWESFGTPENLELNCKGQNTSPWCVFYTVGKVLKRRCQKCPCMSHLNICNTSYVQKKGRESNWQFDSRPLKVEIRPDPGVCRWSATLLESSQGELQVCFRLHPNQRSEQGVMSYQSPGSPNWDNFGTPPWESREKMPFGCRCGEVTQRILYGGRWWLPPSLGRGEFCESKVTRGSS